MKFFRKLMVPYSIVTILTMLFEIAYPSIAYGLTGGPSTPEVQTFEPIGTSDMVDIFSGDFNYNLPLLEVDGYPVNMSYNAGINMDQEASWVGLGWNLNPGAINRNMRGLPDDFNGDEVIQELNIRKNATFGVSSGFGLEMFGKSLTDIINGSYTTGLNYNNYNGVGIEMNLKLGLSDKLMNKIAPGMNAGINISYDGNSGLSLSPKLNFSYMIEEETRESLGLSGGLNASTQYNSRSGMKSLNFGYSFTGTKSVSKKVKDKKGHTRTKSTTMNPNIGFTGSAIDFGTPTFTPSIKHPMNTIAVSFNFALGKEIFGASPGLYFGAYYTEQSLKDKIVVKKAYGFGFAENGDRNSLQDLNREKDQPFSENNTNLPIPVQTPDFYSVSGHGIGGTFRLYRNDIMNFSEIEQSNKSFDIGLGFEIGALNLLKGGVNTSFTFARTESGNWYTHNLLQEYAKSVGKVQVPSLPAYEPSFFRQMGEPTVSNLERNSSLHGYSLLAPIVHVDDASGAYTKYNSKYDPTGKKSRVNLSTHSSNNIQTTRQPRNMLMYGLNALDATHYANQRFLRWFGFPNVTPTEDGFYFDGGGNRINSYRAQHHISEMNVLGADGTRYIYGIPAYNLVQHEITFAANHNEGNCATGLVSYQPSDITSSGNQNGKDNFVQKVTTPGHAYAYLLTGIVSPDYVDLRHDGITDDDLGTAIRFNYFKSGDYKWRVPYEEGKANYSRGNRFDNNDDKGSIVYGEKEVFYLHSIEGKNHIAMFYVSMRNDGVGVQDIHGGISTPPDMYDMLYKLDSIVLYNKQDFYKNGINAQKIKGVHFDYDYSLCQGIPNFTSHWDTTGNNGNGKLTLRSVHFTYGSSFKGRFSPYKFEYASGAQNPNYNLKAQDRWGVYMPAGGNSCGSLILNSSDFPYTPQEKELADLYSGAWNLKEIITPSGARIVIEYESDSYGFVQDKQAMAMYKIAGFSATSNEADMTDMLFTIVPNQVNNYVFFDLGEPMTDPAEFATLIEGIKDFQFTVLVDINGNGRYEYVKGYFDLEPGSGNSGICATNNQLGFCKMKKIPLRDKGTGKQVNPITMNVWNWARIYAQDLVYNRNLTANNNILQNVEKYFYEMVGLYNDVVNMAIGMYNNLRIRGFGKKVHLGSSFLRLNARGYEKFGGGHRVRSIRINDNWAFMGSMNTDAVDSEYGQDYIYEIDEELPSGDMKRITSGVAQYEPNIGSDENPFHQPRYVREELKLVPDIMYMDDYPVGESFMPSASVGYRQVTVSNISHQGVKRTATGKQVYQFFTAKDFPTKVFDSDMNIKVQKPTFTEQLFNFRKINETKVTAGQGYLVELNDMHGKPKAEYIYSETSLEPIGGVIHEYLTNPKDPKELSNKVKVSGPNGSITMKEIGSEVELYNDFRQSLTEVTSSGLEGNLDFFVIGIFPVTIPSLYGNYSKSFNKIQTAVTVKVVSRYGILHKTTAIKEGSKIVTENLLYDDVSGNVLITSVQNEFNDNIYSITKPAHWAYDEGMGPAYKNIGLELKNVNIWEDSIVMPNGLNVRDYLVPGDYVIVYGSSVTVCQVYEGKKNRLNLIQEVNGRPFYTTNPSSQVTLKVVRSGRKNQHNLPIEQISAWRNPTRTSTIVIDSVLSASAVEYNDNWPFYCNSFYNYSCDTVYDIPIPVIQDYFNTIFSSTNVMAGKASIDTACIRYRLMQMELGYHVNIYVKELIEGTPTMVLIDDSKCVTCVDSFFYEIGTGLYGGIPISQFPLCIDNSNCTQDIDYATEIENHEMYDKMRPVFDSIHPNNCPNIEDDSTFRSTMNSYYPDVNSTVRGIQREILNIPFGRCSLTCHMGLFLNGDNCYKRIVEMVSVQLVNDNSFNITLRVENHDGSFDTIPGTVYSDCFPLRRIDCNASCEVPNPTTVLNPYRIGMLGNYRPLRSLAYVGERGYAHNPKPRFDGTFKTFNPYWTYNSSEGKLEPNSTDKWVWTKEVTKYSPFGNEIENIDALGRYSAVLFGFNYTLPTAVGGNTMFKQMAVESFEENSLFWQTSHCFGGHFTFTINNTEQGEITDEFSHSGNYSLKVNPGEYISSSPYSLQNCEVYEDPLDSNSMKWQNCHCVGKFSPQSGKYILSTWMKQGNNPYDTTYNQAKVQVRLNDGTSVETLNLFTSGPIIEGWQRVYAVIDIGTDVEDIEIRLYAASGDVTYFDDFRIHPFNSNMKAYAYDQITLRLMAELDENNFATYYEYNQEGALVRVKKETIRGIMTLKEVRNQIIKLP